MEENKNGSTKKIIFRLLKKDDKQRLNKNNINITWLCSFTIKQCRFLFSTTIRVATILLQNVFEVETLK